LGRVIRVDFLVVDGLHDYASVARDFHAFEALLPAGALVGFHDYADYFPGVRDFVDELLNESEWQEMAQAGSMKLLRRQAIPLAAHGLASLEPAAEFTTELIEVLPPATGTIVR
jgi:Methyltransferase domain